MIASILRPRLQAIRAGGAADAQRTLEGARDPRGRATEGEDSMRRRCRRSSFSSCAGSRLRPCSRSAAASEPRSPPSCGETVARRAGLGASAASRVSARFGVSPETLAADCGEEEPVALLEPCLFTCRCRIDSSWRSARRRAKRAVKNLAQPSGLQQLCQSVRALNAHVRSLLGGPQPRAASASRTATSSSRPRESASRSSTGTS